MLKLIRRGVVANLGRLILTLISVFLGVAFVSGSFVLADSLRSIFDQVAEDAFVGVDAQVRAPRPELSSAELAVARFDDSIVETVAALPEAEYVEGGLFAFEQAYTLNAAGEVVRPLGPPVFTASWAGPSPTSSFELLDGTAPGEQAIVLDAVQAEAGGFAVGDQITVALPSGVSEVFTLAGIVQFGAQGDGGSYFLLFDLPTTQRLLDVPGQIDGVLVNGVDSVSNNELLAAIEAVIPGELEVVSGDTVIGEQQEAFAPFINIFGNILLGFAIVVLFVSIFIIYNTFAILVGQRTQQLGLLRSIGASGAQIRAMVLVESVIVGLVASLLGVFGGIGVAWLLKQLFSVGGGAFPEGPLRILPRTVVVVFVVGLLVTVLSALIPAFRASRVSPLEEVRSGGKHEPRGLRRRGRHRVPGPWDPHL